MQLSTVHQFAFLCTPKCASTSIEAGIRRFSNVKISGHPSLKHINAQEYHDFISPLLKAKAGNLKIETMCLIREPLAWVNSWYRFRTRDDLKDPAHPYHQNYTGNVTFEEFVDAVTDKKPPEMARIGSQSNFICLRNGEIGVNSIFSLERLDIFREYLTKKIGHPVTFAKKNISPKQSVSISEKHMEKIARHFQNDYQIYNRIINS